MGMLGNMIKRFFESRDLKYREIPDENKTVLRVGFNAKNKPSVEVLVIVDEEHNNAAIRSYNYCNAPAEKKADLYKLCSEMNKKYRWVKFYVDDSDDTVSIEDDAILASENCGPEVMELVIRMVGIADEAYPFFMRSLWG